MAQLFGPARSRVATTATFVVLGVVGASVAAWLWNRRGEAALHRQTAERLRPLSQREGA